MSIVHIVHCIDTEGPLYEPPELQVLHIRNRFGISGLSPTRGAVRRLREGAIDAGPGTAEATQFLSSHHQSFMETWDQIDAMFDQLADPAFRGSMLDSFGNSWICNWFCMDHINFGYNPRRRDIGHHNIFDHYRRLLAEGTCPQDAIHWHFHPMSTYGHAHYCGTHYFRSPEIFEILTRKIIEREWFPAVYRAGFQSERPDSNWFLEQWIPFDISSMSIDDEASLDEHVDFRNGRSGDWRGAPTDWSIYHPSHDDYRLPGASRRWIGRALNSISRVAMIDQREMDKAFARAAAGEPTLVGVVGHDWRDLCREVDFIRDLIRRSHRKFPGVAFRFSEAREAFRNVIWPTGASEPPLELALILHHSPADDIPYLEVTAKQGRVFGPQPFLAIETSGVRFFHDNFDFSKCGTKWFYAFHSDTLPLEDVLRIGVAANDQFGNQSTKVLDLTPNRHRLIYA